jgi:hypothetical protein
MRCFKPFGTSGYQPEILIIKNLMRNMIKCHITTVNLRPQNFL